jgi:RNA-directed DNA polymerase
VLTQWILEGDIRACFDQISHAWLLQHVPMDRQILRQWLKAGYWEKGQLFPTPAGTPQGGIISPLLANIALDGMQATIRQAVNRKGDKVNFVRYADDFIVTGATQELLEQKVKPALTAFLSTRGLELSEQKTVITHIHKGCHFLGHTVRKFGDTLLTTPAKSSLSHLQDKIRLCIKSALALSQEALLRQLNPIIRGWANYYRHGAAKRTFKRLDHFVYWQLWRWAKRRHPSKSATWKLRKYFSAGPQKGTFGVWLNKEKGKRQALLLYTASSTKIQRHIKIRGGANPYDPHYLRYFQQRRRLGGCLRYNRATASATRATPQPASVAHWLQDAAACPHSGAPVGAA